MPQQPLDTYDAEHIREQLIADPRTGTQDVQVRVAGAAIVVTGNVPTEERRATIAQVISELAPGVAIRNDVSITDLSEPQGQEVIS